VLPRKINHKISSSVFARFEFSRVLQRAARGSRGFDS
jgi:hypothetical protein